MLTHCIRCLWCKQTQVKKEKETLEEWNEVRARQQKSCVKLIICY